MDSDTETVSEAPIGPIGPTVSGKRNQYFLPGADIEREVIQVDLCAYLNHDATVKPGEYNGVKGFYIYAYRNLTSAQIEDLKSDSAKLRREREQRVKTSNKRKHGQPPPLEYVHSSTHSQTVRRLEEQEQERLKRESPPNDGGYTHHAYGSVTSLPTPVSQRGEEAGYPVSPPQGYQSQGRIPDGFTPPHQTTTPDSHHSHPSSADGRPSNYDRSYPEPYKQEIYSQQYSQAYPQYPAPQALQQSNVGRQYNQAPMAPPPIPAQQRGAPQAYYDQYSDSRMDDRPDSYREQRMDSRQDWMDDRRLDERRMDDRRMDDRRMDSRMDPQPDYRMESHPSYRMESHSDYRMESHPDYRMESHPDYRMEPPRMDPPRMEPPRNVPRTGASTVLPGGVDLRSPVRMDARQDARAGTSMGIRPEQRADPRYEGRGEARDGRRDDPRYRPYSGDERKRYAR